MKRLIVLVVMLTMIMPFFTATADEIGIWQLDYYVDDFNENTNNWYVSTNIGALITDADNHLISYALATVLIDANSVSIALREDFDLVHWDSGERIVNTSSTQKDYRVSIKAGSGEKYTYWGSMEVGQDRIFLAVLKWDESYAENKAIYNELYSTFVNGGEITFVITDEIDPNKQYHFTIDEENGFVDVFPILHYDGFCEGLSIARGADKVGFVDTTGKLIVPCIWDDAQNYNDGYAAVKLNDKWGFIDTSGELVIPCEWNYAILASEGMIAVCDGKKWGYIDTFGEIVIPCEWDFTGSFNGGLAKVKTNGKMGFVDKQGNLVIPCEWDDVGDFINGLAYVKQNDKYGYIDTTGQLIIPCIYTSAYGGFYEDLAWVAKGNQYGFINKLNEIVIACEWSDAKSFSEGLAKVEKANKYGFVDLSGKLVIPCEWDYASWGSFSEGLACVGKNGKIGYIDTTGSLVIPCEWDIATGFNNGAAIVNKGSSWYIINANGDIIKNLT